MCSVLPVLIGALPNLRLPQLPLPQVADTSRSILLKPLWYIELCLARFGSSLYLQSISMKLFLGFSFLLTFLDSATMLQCEVCHSIGRSCSGHLETCSGNADTCGIILHEVTIGGMAIPSSIKTCVPSTVCQMGPVTMNYGKVKARSHLACCVGDACRTASVSLPPENNVPNGFQCPACYSVDSFQCHNETVNCTGSENQCVDLAGLMNTGGLTVKAAMKGCTTISECSVAGDGKNNLGVMDIKIKRYQCHPPTTLEMLSSGLVSPQSLFFPALSGFILEKLLF